MTEICVRASKTYNVFVGDVIEKLEYLPKDRKYALVCDSNAYAFHGKNIKAILSGHNTAFYIFPSGEKHKNINEYYKIINFLAENSFGRGDCIIGFGGGVTGDIAGFAAATYMRGIDYIALPTTLLSMTDSSVGGKTAINIPAGKNLLGAFYQPSAVFCHVPFLRTLPENIFSDGMSEVIKYGVIRDRYLFYNLKNGFSDPENIISRCVEIKRDTVEKDENDKGERMILNFGHTAAHAIEKLSNNEISHGSAVAMGMVIASEYAEKAGICPIGTANTVKSALEKHGHRNKCPFSPDALFSAAVHDKKVCGDKINVVLPVEIGNCCIKQIPLSELIEFFGEKV